jgi:hypothetical protein
MVELKNTRGGKGKPILIDSLIIVLQVAKGIKKDGLGVAGGAAKIKGILGPL